MFVENAFGTHVLERPFFVAYYPFAECDFYLLLLYYLYVYAISLESTSVRNSSRLPISLSEGLPRL